MNAISQAAVPKRLIGDLEVFPVGFGAMTLTQTVGYDTQRGTRTVHAALDRGVRLFDTADVYGPTGAYGVNEAALAAAIRSWGGPKDDVVIATKGGHTRSGDTWWIDGTVAHLRAACLASLKRLGLDSIALYQHHRPDPRIPYEESMIALRDLHDEGLIQRIGISNANPRQIRIAVEVLGSALVAVQNQYSPGFRSSEPEIEVCAELGLAFMSWSPLGGMREAKDLGSGIAAFAEVAAERGVSPQRVAIAWQLSQGAHVIPIPGASRPESVLDSIEAVHLRLTPAELERLG